MFFGGVIDICLNFVLVVGEGVFKFWLVYEFWDDDEECFG